MTDSTASALTGGQGGAPAAAPAPAAGAPAAAPAPVAGTPAAAPAPASGITWLGEADETTVGYVQNKGWTEPKQVLEGYRNLEKLLGADKAGNAVILPKHDAPQADWDAFHSRLGRPQDAAGYKIEVPQGLGDPEFAKAAAGKFHELGLTQKQGESLAKWWNEQAGAATTAQQGQQAQAFQADEAALKTDWGQAYNQNLTQAQAAVRGLGISAEQIDKLSSSMGHKATMEFFQKIGSRMGEADFVSGKNEGFGSAMTPGQAKAEIQALSKDKAFTAKLLSKDAEAAAKWTQLHKFAFPEA